jgi:hypothetical protein
VCLEEHADLQTDLADLEAKENQIDDLIRNAKLQIKLLTEDKQYAYVSYQVGLPTGTLLTYLGYLKDDSPWPLRECQDIMDPASACLVIIRSPIRRKLPFALCFFYALRNAFAVVVCFSAGGILFQLSCTLCEKKFFLKVLGAVLGSIGSVDPLLLWSLFPYHSPFSTFHFVTSNQDPVDLLHVQLVPVLL